jgi:uncharacterized protein
MSLLNGLFRKEDRFLSLLEASAEEGRASIKELGLLLKSPPTSASLDKLLAARDKERQIGEEFNELLCQGGAAPMDREDLETLSGALGRIPRGIKKFGERYQLYAKRVHDVSFDRQVEMLKTAVNAVAEMVSDLKAGSQVAAAKVHHDTLQRIESEADELYISLVMELYQKREDPLKAIMLKDLYELLERVFDRCRSAGNTLLRLTLKNS